jgi:ribonuclease HI
VGDAVELARLKDHDARKRDRTCPCNTCSDLEIHAGCNSLENCIHHANKLIERISPKWKPKLGLSIIIPPREPTLHITNGTIGTLPKKATIIRKRTKTSSVNDTFRILKGNEMNCDEELNEEDSPKIPHTLVEVAYTDGSCEGNRLSNATSGSGIHFPGNPNKDLAIKVPGTSHSNQIGEIYTITKAVQTSDMDKNLIIIADSDYAIKSLSTRLPQAENNGWTNIKINPWIKETIDSIKRKKGEVAICWTKAHTNEQGNERANKLAKEGTNKPSPDWAANKTVGRITGLKLLSISQSLAYHASLQEKSVPELNKVSNNLHRIQSDMSLGIMKQSPTHDTIWKDLKQTRNIY